MNSDKSDDTNPAVYGAFEILKDAMKGDDSYAWSWHCNIAMSMVDEGFNHYKANLGAARFMQICFGVNTREFKEFPKELNMTTDHELLSAVERCYENFAKAVDGESSMAYVITADLELVLDRLQSLLSDDSKLRDVELPAWKLTAKSLEAGYMLSQEENKRMRKFIAGIPKASECEPFLASLPQPPEQTLKPTGEL